jgi:selenocysteine-specific elongation factor
VSVPLRAGTVTLGTAGHIDHGKTALVRVLTGRDTDRLPEERRRGISIDLGYAPLELPDGRTISVVDVPGHERFVRTMVAGASGIDLFLLVVDAREGARPQTHEHLAILRLLGIDQGVVAVTKADLVDEETLELALEEARELVPDAEAVAVSAVSGHGLDELRGALADAADLVLQKHKRFSDEAPTRLPIDRAFTLRGIGTVVTGTLWSGSIGEGDVLALEPGGLEARVRSVQVHDRQVARAEAGRRVAVSLPGLDRRRIRRGHSLVLPGAFPRSYRLDVALEELEPAAADGRVTVHHGTAETPGRIVRVGERWAQLRTSRPLVAARGDRVVLRAATTIGGGLVLDPAPPRHADATRFEHVERGDLAATVHAPVRADSLGLSEDALPEGVESTGGWLFSSAWLAELRAGLREQLAAADPLDPGIEPPAGPWLRDVLPLIGLELRGSRLYEAGATASLGARADDAERLEAELAAVAPAAAKVEDPDLARFLEREGRLVRLGGGHAVSRAAYDRTVELVQAECARAGRIALARFRDLAGVGRRDAQLLLERMDADGVTRRVGDARLLRRSSSR